MDILIDKKMNAWLMEINANPSLNMFLEKEGDLLPGQEPERILQELDRYVKSKVIGDACRIVGDQAGCEEFDDTFEKIEINDEDQDYYIWNRATKLFELMAQAGKEPDLITKDQFNRVGRITAFGKMNQFFKADLDICFKNMLKKYDCQFLDIHAFFELLETVSIKIFRAKPSDDDELSVSECLDQFLTEAIPFYE